MAALSTIDRVPPSSTRVVQSCTAVPTAPAQTFSDNVCDCVAYTVTMRSASTVDAAIERTCAGDAHGPQAAVSAIGRGRWGRWQRIGIVRAAASQQRARCTDAVWTIESDVYAARTGQVAAHGGHAGAY